MKNNKKSGDKTTSFLSCRDKVETFITVVRFTDAIYRIWVAIKDIVDSV